MLFLACCLVTLMMEEINSSETMVLIRATWNNIPEDGILQFSKKMLPVLETSQYFWYEQQC
jgi:hypothetical protein